MTYDVLPGKSFPLGATVAPDGTNFCIFSKYATAIELLLFDGQCDRKPSRIVKLDPKDNKTFHYWHVFLPGVKAGQIYAYRAHGEFEPKKGLRFDRNKVLLDPYARALVGEEIYDRKAAIAPGDNCDRALRGVVVDPSTYNWEGDRPLRIPYANSVIYEMHVGGFTRHPNSGLPPQKRGTYAGIIEKIPYLKELGITAVELLPVHHFDPEDAPPGLINYWGYSTIAFFAPHRYYSSRRDPLGAVDEFRDMVKALHKAGIEVILDVVFNHTAEGNHEGPTLSFRGLDNKIYYLLEEDNFAYYSNYSGCGNTFRANHPIPGELILDSLRYWVAEMHVDGFRFDLASVLSRDTMGAARREYLPTTPEILWAIESDPILAGTKLIAEAWDAAGLYQVGTFIGFADWFAEWNGPFRDDIRSFIKSDSGTVCHLAARLLASPDIYPRMDNVNRSINFVTCHDGFTLNDLVSYNSKHNEANLEENRDGTGYNFSWNCGIEGETDDREIEALRSRQIKNCLVLLLISQGTPMLLMGDEVRRSQKGNNNAYCQDNELSWFDWSGVEKHSEMLHFVKKLIGTIQSFQIFQQENLLKVSYASHAPHLIWHGVRLGEPDWTYDSHSLAFSLRDPACDEYLHVMLNAYWEPLEFELPLLGHCDRWHRLVDTSLDTPDDCCDPQSAPPVVGKAYTIKARSLAMLMVQPSDSISCADDKLKR